MKTIYRDHLCGMISEKEIGREIRISGFVSNIRDHGGILFLDIRDESGVMQVVSMDDKILMDINKESSVTVTGIIRERDIDDYNDKISTGRIELLISKIECLNKVRKTLPFEIITSHELSTDIRFKYRYLDLRNKKIHDLIVNRTKVIKYLRDMMSRDDFLEITTPIITSSSPEGARDFIIPSRKFYGKFYALPQAPQVFKQLLMASGFEKYFQIAPCFRDEDARVDRLYGEFYQLDLEMAYVTEEDVLKVGKKIFRNIFKKFVGWKKIEFPEITYRESISKYGTDKPDLRIPYIIQDVSKVFDTTTFKPFRGVEVKAIVVPSIYNKSNSWYNELQEYAKSIGLPGIGYFKVMDDMSFNGPIDKFLTDKERKDLIEIAGLKKKDVIFFIADKDKALKYASLVRIELGRKMGYLDTKEYKFCIVKNFPMYEYDIETDKYKFCHNPFSMPKCRIDDMTMENIDKIEAYQYDFVCNGIEMASGAVRCHKIEMMKKVFSLIGYGEDKIRDKFGALYEAFCYGTPPHAGMAIGIERMLMLINDTSSIREVVAFPLNASGIDMMMQTPDTITEEQLRETHIKIR